MKIELNPYGVEIYYYSAFFELQFRPELQHLQTNNKLLQFSQSVHSQVNWYTGTSQFVHNPRSIRTHCFLIDNHGEKVYELTEFFVNSYTGKFLHKNTCDTSSDSEATWRVLTVTTRDCISVSNYLSAWYWWSSCCWDLEISDFVQHRLWNCILHDRSRWVQLSETISYLWYIHKKNSGTIAT